MKYSNFLMAALTFIFCIPTMAMEHPFKRLKLLQEECDRRTNLGEQLIQAVCHGTPDVVSDLLNAGAPLDYEDAVYRTALNWAVIKGRVEMLELLLAAGADLNHISRDGPTVLQHVICYDRIEMLPIIIAAGAEVRYFYGSSTGDKPLQFAARYGYSTMCSMIVEKMMTLPSKAQKRRMYTFMNCMKRLHPVQYPNMRNFFKPVLKALIQEENRDSDSESYVLQQIEDLSAGGDDSDEDEHDASEEVKRLLLECYYI